MSKNIKLLLNTISNYCIDNPEYCFWYQNKFNYYRLYMGYRSTYEKFQDRCDYEYGTIDKEFIKNSNLTFDYDETNAIKSKIQTYHDWDVKDNHRYKLFTYCRERVDNEFFYINCFDIFFQESTGSIDIEKCLEFGNFKNIKDWSFFTSNLSDDDWSRIWSNYPQIVSLVNYFNKNFNTQEKKDFLEPLINQSFFKEINEESLNLYYFLTKVFNENEVLEYSNYLVVKNSLKSKEIFEESTDVVEKVVTNSNIFRMKNYEKYSIAECNNFYMSIVNEMNKNIQLKQCGLLEVEFISNKNDCNNVFYINKEKNSLFNKSEFEKIWIEILEQCSEYPILETINEKMPAIINNWYFNSTIPLKEIKIKKFKI